MQAVSFIVYGDPVPFARAGSFGKRRFTPAKQRDYMLHVRSVAWQAMKKAPPMTGPLSMSVIAVYETPASWSKKKAIASLWKESRPDVDNLAKAVMDCIGTNESLAATDKLPAALVYGDDAQVVKLYVEKHYGARAYISVQVEPAPGILAE
jgi:Holliday junction resolvase RusA-like endonuclease